jgi:hypothetical protein
MYDGKRALVKKGLLPRTHTSRFQRARVVDRNRKINLTLSS